MIHLGDITKISGYDAHTVDCVIGGSPCQDLSIAGKRAGLAGERSGLFMEQIRIVKQMREVDRQRGRTGKAIRPRFMVWENVPGAFSSNRGEDFRAVLEETIRIAAPDAPSVPLPPKGRWPLADAYYGDGWSVAYRVFDAQFWGVPQRRRRIALVADFGGHAAPKILFERQSVCGDIAEGETPGKAPAPGIRGGIDSPVDAEEIAPAAQVYENHQQDSRVKGPLTTAPTVNAKYGMGGNNVPLVLAFNGGQSEKARSMGIGIEMAPTLGAGLAPPVVAAVDCRNGTIDPEINGTLQAKPNGGMSLNLNNVVMTYPPEIAHCLKATEHLSFRADSDTLVMATGQANAEIIKDLVPTLNCDHEQPIIFRKGTRPHSKDEAQIWEQTEVSNTLNTFDMGEARASELIVCSIVRRLTPLECERLQGYPDGWTDIGAWIDSGGKLHTECTDSARYTALGNSIALPIWRWVLRRLCRFYRRKPTMASLFDGIGGFPLIWEQLNGPGTCLWASEIEDFPIAVTKRHFRWRETAGKDRTHGDNSNEKRVGNT